MGKPKRQAAKTKQPENGGTAVEKEIVNQESEGEIQKKPEETVEKKSGRGRAAKNKPNYAEDENNIEEDGIKDGGDDAYEPDADSEVAQELPKKKKKGAAKEKVKPEEEMEVQNGKEKEQETMQPPAKKKGGKAKVDVAEQDPEAEKPEDDDEDEIATKQETKKKGKAKGKAKKETTVEDDNDKAEDAEAPEMKEPPLKKKRGRPAAAATEDKGSKTNGSTKAAGKATKGDKKMVLQAEACKS